MDLSHITWDQVLLVFGICAGSAVVGAVALLITAAKQIKQMEIPEGADFFTTLQYVPITVPIALDLLDLAFDFFSAPITWIILEMLGLQALQMITIFEGILPGTQIIPTMTAAWVIARVMGNKKSETREALADYNLQQIDERRQKRLQLQDQYKRRSLLGSGIDNVLDGEIIEDPDVIRLDKKDEY